MKNSRFWGRLFVFVFLSLQLFLGLFQKRKCPNHPQKILVLHTKLLGDSIIFTSLLKTLRVRFPSAKIFLALPPAFVELLQTNPYNIDCLAFDVRQIQHFWTLKRHAPFDFAVLPLQNRYSLLCRALGARWIIGFEKDKKTLHNFFVDEKIPFPKTPAAFVDFCTQLCPSPIPKVFYENEWQKTIGTLKNLPPLPKKPFAVLHVDASSPTKFWNPKNWQSMAEKLADCGFSILFTGATSKIPFIKTLTQTDPRFFSCVGQCSLLQLKEVLENAALVISPDTGIAHLVKLTGTPNITLFGPAPSSIFGAGEFFKNHPCREIPYSPPPPVLLNQ